RPAGAGPLALVPRRVDSRPVAPLLQRTPARAGCRGARRCRRRPGGRPLRIQLRRFRSSDALPARRHAAGIGRTVRRGMTLPRLDASRARELVGRFAGQRVLVVGDAMLDRFIVGQVTRISPEAPVPVVRFQSEHVRLGGAANVAHNIAALGGKPSLVAMVGADAAAARLREQLEAAGVNVSGLVEDRSRPTTEKVRIVTERNQQVARLDYEQDADAAGEVQRALVDRVEGFGSEASVLLVSDYLKGAVTRPVFEALLAVASAAPIAAAGRTRERDHRGGRIPLIVDPKIPHLAAYAGATLITPNHHEAEVATHLRVRTDGDAQQAA